MRGPRARGEDAEVRSRLSCGEPPVRDAEDFFSKYPKEAAIVLQRSVELSALLSSVLLAHCARLAWQETRGAHDPDGLDIDEFLRGLCFARVACMAPRPYWWFRERMSFARARGLATPQHVARRLLEIQSCPRSDVEKLLRGLYYTWLLFSTATVYLLNTAPEPTALTRQLWFHLLLNYVGMAIHRVGCMLMFYCLMHSDRIKRGVSKGALDAHSLRIQFAGGASCTEKDIAPLGESGGECSICLCEYAVGEEIRRLGCGHCFHRGCLDPWLLKKCNRCPLCNDTVGFQQ